MKKLLFLITIFCTLETNAQVYLISFAGTGASASVGSVKVENLTAGTSLTLSGGNVLRLNILTGIDPVKNKQLSGLKIYPNPATDNSVLQIYPPVEGNADIKVFDMTGREVTQMRSYLENSLQEFRLSGIRKGFYMISVTGDSYSLSGKLISNGKSSGQISMEKISNNLAAEEKTLKNAVNKGIQDYVDMLYSVGDRIKFTGISGNYSTVKTDIPTGDKTITFNFISCTDGDNINYPVVEIGTQVWMAENLKTTKYRNGDLIGTTTPVTLGISYEVNPKYQWSYDGNESNAEIYGRLYTWYVVTDIRKVCPTGWHVPSDTEWTILSDYLTNNGYGYEGSGSDIAKSLSASTVWSASPTVGSIGNILTGNNSSGFTAMPAGVRYRSGVFANLNNMGGWWSTSEDYSKEGRSRGITYNTSSLQNYLQEKNWASSIRCLKGEGPIIITTAGFSSFTQASVFTGGNITNDGSGTITSRGVCWSTSGNPTIADYHTSDGNGMGSFISLLTGLTANTIYYLRAYATNSESTAYGNERIFATKGETGTISDIEGNTYSTMVIGTQTWMSENLKTTHYNNNIPIPLVTDNALWSALTTPAYCWYNNDAATYKDLYGGLYNWYAVGTDKLCPVGWHVPSDTDWLTLTDYLRNNGYAYVGGYGNYVAKSMAASSGWNVYDEIVADGEVGHDQESNNNSGFTALPGGYRGFGGIGSASIFWSSSKYPDFGPTWAISFGIHYNGYEAMTLQMNMTYGYSVRCFKN